MTELSSQPGYLVKINLILEEKGPSHVRVLLTASGDSVIADII